MRIIAGKYRGTALANVGKGDTAAHLRPTSDRVRESLFSMLTHHDVVHGARVLDLFAGTGALGLEALSRGATEVCFVENGRVGQKLLRENIEKLRVEAETALMRNDATRLGSWPNAAFDLVFLDPPYGKGMGQTALAAARTGGWLAPDAMIIWEENAPMNAPEGFERLDKRKYGDTHVTLLRHVAAG
ncbi:16S rRNA (guanine(966)-N(2))-methyltransferase RsmD [Sulfitobacter mediterraneus]|uniref:16S rRNA (guanine(966)-N(2))-methyltransferase RsmD n=1 Tax=Sulfitobacter mediterraneus TaxID=83219 RepID=UPI0019337252|nr:16S rRNA (guanine(966)-N(2))-methyltransferase RsmD [Sulfitobacter mediterraneus]MBM1310198.1 16S rRNA (guanine(966)-N(2))-methyltransferase RsmD [Sulfitobacter mediterraneus]MBM1314082.1 16S rRNA (guanine(966)-N(2))-methyltransferase RsmD [Sulfitobacter mediterraneus]MBM1322442.1 16S rRNA (guanine(966)-N(2))-methyltransferase RsmD [Sulfitobacter mediterraneus]MBM1326354.1 16S rRNA (guanine(966)-N(2))-methyltransferase RsmD [Sulfitobacter mediterraneus]MBM1397700.1 16S rRNA (guanine(966)-N(